MDTKRKLKDAIAILNLMTTYILGMLVVTLFVKLCYSIFA